eukprot:TRINITY_DN2817_c0_g1_i15.p1 TRINITY_DN2817_c0_g1~~TRINITY_DN2817_c0_g1_i15.p1  ORF type:complete len:308 (+),score=41.62 TRINITY_DN2817_c0_g1_i15:82-1005(+)
MVKCARLVILVLLATNFSLLYLLSRPDPIGTLPSVEPGLANIQPEITNRGERRVAYAFYATAGDYMCSVIVNTRILLNLNAEGDFVVIQDYSLTNDPLDQHFLSMAPGRTKIVRVFDVPLNSHSYYQHVFVKYSIFGLVEYSRIIYMDSDALVLKKLDDFFNFPSQMTIAAPMMYWGNPKSTIFTSAFMIITPNKEMVRTLQEYSVSHPGLFDLDVLNDLYINSTFLLPGYVMCLNSHWETGDTAAFGGISLSELRDKCSLLHFTALGKPWTYPGDLPRRYRPASDPWFSETFETWWNIARQEGCYS